MKLELTKEQQEAIALAWIQEQQSVRDGYREVLRKLFNHGHMAQWSWLDALRFAVSLCIANYAVTRKWIIKELK